MGITTTATQQPIDQVLYDTALLSVMNHATQLAQAGRPAEQIYQELVAFNQEQCQGMVDDSELRLQAETAATLYGPSSYKPDDPVLPLKTAIENDDADAIMTPPCVAILARLKRTEPLRYGIYWSKIKAFRGKISLRSLDAAIIAERRNQETLESGAKQDVADVARDWAARYRDTWAYDARGQVWRMWDESHWAAQEDRGSALDQYAVAALQEAHIAVNSTGILNAFLRIAASHCRLEFLVPEGKINFANGTLDVASGQLGTFNRDDGFIACLPFSYEPYGTHPHIDAFLNDTIPDVHGQQAYKIHVGLALLQDTWMHWFLLLLGPPRAGKSTLLALANAMCGMVEPWSFAGSSLFARDLEGKRSRYKWSMQPIVCVDELPPEVLRQEELLKSMSAHSSAEMRGIGRDEQTDNRWRPKLILCTNDTPHYQDTSGAVRERAIIIECPNGPRPKQKQDKKLFTERLLPELGAFAATCIKLALAAQVRGYYPLSVAMQNILARISTEGNPFKLFLQESCILDPQAETPIDDIHAALREYCAPSRVMASNSMSRILGDMHVGVTSGGRKRVNGKLVRILKGIRLRTDSDPDLKETAVEPDALLSEHEVCTMCERSENDIVHTLNEPVEPSHDGVCTMCTIYSENVPIQETSTQTAPPDAFVDDSYSVNGKSNISYTSYTAPIGQPIERGEPVNDKKEHRSQIVHRTQPQGEKEQVDL